MPSWIERAFKAIERAVAIKDGIGLMALLGGIGLVGVWTAKATFWFQLFAPFSYYLSALLTLALLSWIWGLLRPKNTSDKVLRWRNLANQCANVSSAAGRCLDDDAHSEMYSTAVFREFYSLEVSLKKAKFPLPSIQTNDEIIRLQIISAFTGLLQPMIRDLHIPEAREAARGLLEYMRDSEGKPLEIEG